MIQQRRRKGVVDDDQALRILRMGSLCDLFDIGDPHRRIGDRLAIHHRRVRTKRSLHRTQISHVDFLDFHAEIRQLMGHQIECTAVHRLIGKQMIAAFNERQNGGAHGTHAGCIADRDFPAGILWLAHCHANGIGVKKDLEEARKWARKAADLGIPAGRQMLLSIQE